MTICVIGFNNERLDPVSEVYHLGNGYRIFSKTLLRFNSPDSWSPCGQGGINPYAYCAGEPINHIDPTGHISWQAGIGIGLGIIGMLGAVFTGGASVAAAGSIATAISSASLMTLIMGASTLVSDVSGIASATLQDSAPEASCTLGWISLTSGLVALTEISILRTIDKRVMKSVNNLGNSAMREPRSGHTVEQGIYYYNDVYKNNMRLNIVAHGLKKGNKAVIQSLNGDHNPHQFMDIINANGFITPDVKNVRLIMCYSARGGTDSFAHELSQLLHLPVKGYKKSVSAVFVGLESMKLTEAASYLLSHGEPMLPVKFFKPGDMGWFAYHFYRIWGGLDSYAPKIFYPIADASYPSALTGSGA